MEILDYKAYSNQKVLEGKNIKITPKVSLLICFYNNIPLFDLMMTSIEQQTFKEFEVILCDDGSKPNVVEHIHHYMKQNSFPMQHLWHKDDGWRKVELLNKALASCSSDYVITIDQDCLPHPEFIREHFENREANTALSGRRVELSPFLTQLVTPERIRSHFLQLHYWWMFFVLFFIKDNQWDKGLYIRNSFLRKIFNRKPRALVGCNMSYFKSDMIKINGYDMSQKVPCGAEDSDVEVRMRHAGIQIKPICNAAVQYHLYHKKTVANQDAAKTLQDARKKTMAVTHGYSEIQPAEKTYL